MPPPFHPGCGDPLGRGSDMGSEDARGPGSDNEYKQATTPTDTTQMAIPDLDEKAVEARWLGQDGGRRDAT